MTRQLVPDATGSFERLTDILGTGWAFPPEPVGQRWPWVSGPAAVRQALRLLLATEPGERVMRPDFGCGLRQFLMAPNTPGTRAAIAEAVKLAIGHWEPRVVVQSVEVISTADPGFVLCTVSYVHVRDGSPSDLQMPVSVGSV